ncbi:MAG TPA: 4Fe-4S binding protein [Nocardioidaceae bacterium]|nr:4Fe-4S binding protein [Nocardioidaceae bacterium]
MAEPDAAGASEQPPARSRGVIALQEENCTVCMLCARECPAWCITIESHTETTQQDGERPLTANVLDRFALDTSLCLYCSICIDVCPFDALHWAPEPLEPGATRDDLVHERDTLRRWLWTVPPPPGGDGHSMEAT